MNRIEKRLEALQQKNQKAFITYMTAGLPDYHKMKEIIHTQEKSGVDILELGIPFSDPAADGPVIQDASFRAIKQGVNLTGIFAAVKEIREEKAELPILFMMYYNTVLHYGIEAFTAGCMECGVDGLIIPDLPLEEQGALRAELRKNAKAPILIQLVSPVSRNRVPEIVREARGFIYCVSSMGVTGQSTEFHVRISEYLAEVKDASDIPVMMGFGIQKARDIKPVRDVIDGAIVGTHFMKLMEQSNYDIAAIADYCRTFKQELNA